MAEVRTIEVWADTRGMATCKGCGAVITWAEIVRSGKKMCFDGEALALQTRYDHESARMIEAIEFETNHWASCPKAKEFKR
jgi:hypothetical protein